MEDNIEPFTLMKDLFNAIERQNAINIDNFNLYQGYGRIIRSIRGKNDDVKDLLLEDIKMLANISHLSKKSRRGILLALYDSFLKDFSAMSLFLIILDVITISVIFTFYVMIAGIQ